MNKRKILQVNKLYYPVTGGVERVVQQLAEGLRDKTDMKVLVCRKKGKGYQEIIRGVEVNRSSSLGVLFSMPISFAFIRDLRKLSKDRDVLHLHMPFPLGDLAILLSGFKGKLVVSWHSDVVRQKKLMTFYKPIMKRLLKRADVILVATEGHILGSDYLEAYRDKCCIVPYGVHEYLVKQAERSEEYIRPEGEPVNFLFVGRLVYYKGCSVLIEAFSKIKNARLTMIGTGPLQQELMEQAKTLGIADKVIFREHLADKEVAEEFRKCDVFVLPSVEKSEAFGLVQIEAMAYGKPVINTRLNSGVPYVSLDGQTGVTVPPGDADALADAMQKLAEDPELCRIYGAAAKERVQKNFALDDMLNRILEIYEN